MKLTTHTYLIQRFGQIYTFALRMWIEDDSSSVNVNDESWSIYTFQWFNSFHFFFFFFLYGSTTLYRVLAFSTSFSFHPLLSSVRVFQFGTVSVCISFLISSTQRVFGLPIGLLEMGYQEYIAFTILVPCILST